MVAEMLEKAQLEEIEALDAVKNAEAAVAEAGKALKDSKERLRHAQALVKRLSNVPSGVRVGGGRKPKVNVVINQMHDVISDNEAAKANFEAAE